MGRQLLIRFFDCLEVLTEWWPWLSSWFATLAILSDPEYMKRINAAMEDYALFMELETVRKRATSLELCDEHDEGVEGDD